MKSRHCIRTALGLCLVVLALQAGCSGSTKDREPGASGTVRPTAAKKASSAPGVNACTTDVGLPPDVVVNPPTADASPDAAAFAGSWEGVWDWPTGRLPARLVVTNVQGNKVSLVYAWGATSDTPPGYSRAGEVEVQGDKIEVGGPEMIFTFSLDPGEKSLSAKLDARLRILTATLRRCGPVPGGRP